MTFRALLSRFSPMSRITRHEATRYRPADRPRIDDDVHLALALHNAIAPAEYLETPKERAQ